MTVTIYLVSQSTNGTVATLGADDVGIVEAGVNLSDTDFVGTTSASDAIYDAGDGTADILGSLLGYNAIYFGGGSAVTTVDIGAAASILALGSVGVEVATGAVAIDNAGAITTNIMGSGSGDGILVNGAGSIVNTGTITAAGDGIANTTANPTFGMTITNYGTISSANYGISETGGGPAGFALIYNHGSIVGKESAIQADSVSNVWLFNSGTISGGATLLGAGDNRIINTGTMDTIVFGGSASLQNSGHLFVVQVNASSSSSRIENTGDITNQLTSYGSNTIVNNQGFINLIEIYTQGAALTNSGTIDDGAYLTGASGYVVNVSVDAGGAINSAPGYTALTVTAGAYEIKNAGDITATVNSSTGIAGISVDGAGSIVNDGKIYSAGVGVENTDSSSSDQSYLYNYGTISGLADGVSDTGGHYDEIYNYGNIDGGAGGYAIYSDAKSYDYLWNDGSISGAVYLGAPGSGVDNTGHINGEVFITNSAGNSSLSNSGIISAVLANTTGFYLDNSGAITNAPIINGAGSTVVNSGTLRQGVLFGAGSDTLTNDGTIIGDVTFAGTGNVYNGANGSVTGKIVASGTGTYIGGAGADTFAFTAAGLTAGDTVQGGGSNDTLVFTTAGAISANALVHVSGIETVDLANGTNSLTLTNALVASAIGGTLTVNGGTGADTINASAVSTANLNVVIDGGAGADTITAGAAHDTFVYNAVGDSSGASATSYDTISGVNFAHDYFDVPDAPGSVTAIDAAVTVGSLSSTSFQTDLTSDIGASHLGAHAAVLFTASAGTLDGDTFLIVNLGAAAGFNVANDLVFHLTGQTGTLTTANFT